MLRRHLDRIELSLLLPAIVAVALAGSLVPPASAADPGTENVDATIEQHYDDLAEQVRQIRKDDDVLVKVARIIAPAVVHIQAKKPHPTSALSLGMVEEAWGPCEPFRSQ